jgi:hypothetical protein
MKEENRMKERKKKKWSTRACFIVIVRKEVQARK